MRSIVAFLLLGSAAIAARQPQPVALQGVITQVQGAVEAIGPGMSDLPLASPWQVIRIGTTIRVPKGGYAGVVCSNRRFVRLWGPTAWPLSEAACAKGKELTAAEYALIAPQGGRFKVVEGLLVLEREIRSDDNTDPLAPLVLSPRNTILRSPRPTISWSQVPSATDYQIQWIGRNASAYEVQLQAEEVTCSEKLEGISVCSLPWSKDRPDLPPGEIFFLRIAARSGIAEPWRANDPVEARTQEIALALTLEHQIDDLKNLGLEGIALDVARAGLFAEKGLYGEAADQYRRVLAAAPTPELLTTVADLEFAMGLHFLAEPRYRAALVDDAPPVRAAAAFGLGRIDYSRGNYRDATASFRQARELYSQLGLKEEEHAARRAAIKATARVPKWPSSRTLDSSPPIIIDCIPRPHLAGSPVRVKAAQKKGWLHSVLCSISI